MYNLKTVVYLFIFPLILHKPQIYLFLIFKHTHADTILYE